MCYLLLIKCSKTQPLLSVHIEKATANSKLAPSAFSLILLIDITLHTFNYPSWVKTEKVLLFQLHELLVWTNGIWLWAWSRCQWRWDFRGGQGSTTLTLLSHPLLFTSVLSASCYETSNSLAINSYSTFVLIILSGSINLDSASTLIEQLLLKLNKCILFLPFNLHSLSYRL